MVRASSLVALLLIAFADGAAEGPPQVRIHRLPSGAVQPRAAVDDRGTIHLIYFRGDAAHGDVFYSRSTDGDAFSNPIQVNSIGGSAIATGTVRGAQIAVGRRGRVHVAWNGSRPAAPDRTPMFYARLNDAGSAFEPERNVMHDGFNIDGGGAVAADRDGRVYVAWHANAPGDTSEGRRRVWIVRSMDDGATFDRERAVFDEPTGVCGCCELGAFADASGRAYILFRSALDVVHRDMYLLTSRDHGQQFTGSRVDRWNVGICVMSTQAFAQGPSSTLTAWETQGQIHAGTIDANGGVTRIISAPGATRTRKHPALAVDAAGRALLAWTEGTAWNKGGAAAWQVFGADGRPLGATQHADGVPTWGLVAASVHPGGGFVTIY